MAVFFTVNSNQYSFLFNVNVSYKKPNISNIKQ